MRIFQSKPSRKRPRIGSTKGNPLARCQVKLLSHGITEGCQVSKSLFTVKIPEACITHITKQNTGGHGGLNQGSKKSPICWSGMSRFSSWESNLIRKLTCLLGFDWENFGLLDRWSHKRRLHVKVPLYFFTLYTALFWDLKHGRRSRGCQATTFIDQLERRDSGLSRQDLAPIMANRQKWDRPIKSVRVHQNR